MTQTPRGGRSGSNRGQVAIVAIVLLIGLVAIGSVGILLIGANANEQSQDRAELDRIEKAFTELDTDIDTVARSQNGRRIVDLALPDNNDAAIREEDKGRIFVNRTNFTTGVTDTLVDRSIGAIEYTGKDGTVFAYQSGAVWRETGAQTTMVSAPPFSYDLDRSDDNPTLTLPITTTSGDRRLTGGNVLIKKNATISPLNDVTVVENDLVSVRIKSDYYLGWAQYFRAITSEEAVAVDHRNRTATMELVVPAQSPSLKAGVVAGAAGEVLDLQQGNVVDSYNSSNQPYAATPASKLDDGVVIVEGDVDLRQDATIKGDLELGGEINVRNTSTITGNFSNTSSGGIAGGSDHPKDHVNGWLAENASITPRSELDGMIDLRRGQILDENDNAAAANISSGTLDGCSSTCTLSSGVYFLDHISLGSNDELVLDTSGGPISILVDNDVDLGDDATIRVEGTDRVNVYVDGETGTEDVALKQDSQVVVPDQRAPQMWFYLDSDADVTISQLSTFTGVLYGPGSGSPGAVIDIGQDVDIWGAVVGDVDPLQQGTDIHYDRALTQTDTLTTNAAIPKLTFLHVSVYDVDVENDG